MIKNLIPLEFHERQQFIEIRVPKIPAHKTKLRDKRAILLNSHRSFSMSNIHI